MSILDTGPCQRWDCDTCGPWPDTLEPYREVATQAATEILWNRTKRRFGLCEFTLRPCKRSCLPSGWGGWRGGWTDVGAGWPFPALIGGAWFNLGCGSCGDDCSCTTLQQVQLPYPVADVLQILIDGEILPASAYRVDSHRFLVRVDGGSWPSCNDLSSPDTEPGTWSVRATYGEQVPTLGSIAARDLAIEIAKACAGDVNGCQLPGGMVQTITRQGVTKRFVDSASQYGTIGLRMPDLFIQTYNPTRSGMATIIDIDSPRPRRVGT